MKYLYGKTAVKYLSISEEAMEIWTVFVVGMPGTTQALEPCVANPPGAGIVAHRRAVQVSWTEPEVPQWPHTTKRDKDSWAFASTVCTRYPLILQLSRLLPQLTPGHQVPIQQLELQYVSKVSCSRKQQQHQSGLAGNETWILSITRQMP